MPWDIFETFLQQMTVLILALHKISVGWDKLLDLAQYLSRKDKVQNEVEKNNNPQPGPQGHPKQLPAQIPSFLHVYNRIYVALLDVRQAEIISKNVLTCNYCIVPLSAFDVAELCEPFRDSDSFTPASLGDIFKFDEIASSLQRKHPRMKLVFQAGEDKAIQLKVVFLLGCHMMMRHDCGFEETYLSFKGMQSLFDSKAPESADTVSITSCWRAFYCAKRLNWMEFDTVATETTCDNRCIHMDEYMHYARWRATECYVPMFAQDT